MGTAIALPGVSWIAQAQTALSLQGLPAREKSRWGSMVPRGGKSKSRTLFADESPAQTHPRLEGQAAPPSVSRSLSASARNLPSLMYSIDEDRSGHRWTFQKCLLADISAPRFAERDLWNVWFGHSGLIFAALMIGHHFSTSDLWKAAKPSGVCCSRAAMSKPSSPKRVRTPGSASVCTIAPLSLMMMSRGVPLGATSPNHPGM